LSRRPDQSYVFLQDCLVHETIYFPPSSRRYNIGGLTSSPLPSLSYILSVLFKSEDSEKADSIMDTLEKIEEIVLQTVLPDGESVRHIEKKMLKCRVEELSPPKSRKRKSEETTGDIAEKKIKLEDPSEAPLPGLSILT
jgi:hypothetical protein